MAEGVAGVVVGAAVVVSGTLAAAWSAVAEAPAPSDDVDEVRLVCPLLEPEAGVGVDGFLMPLTLKDHRIDQSSHTRITSTQTTSTINEVY